MGHCMKSAFQSSFLVFCCRACFWNHTTVHCIYITSFLRLLIWVHHSHQLLSDHVASQSQSTLLSTKLIGSNHNSSLRTAFYFLYFLSFFQCKLLYILSDRTHFSSIKLYLILDCHWPGLTAVYQTTHRTCTVLKCVTGGRMRTIFSENDPSCFANIGCQYISPSVQEYSDNSW